MKPLHMFAATQLSALLLTLLPACSPDDGAPLPDSEPPLPAPGQSDATDPEPPQQNGLGIRLRIGTALYTATLEDTATGRAFAALLPLEIEMDELNGNEKYCYLGQHLPTATYRPGTIRAGDLMLYGSNCVVLFYESFTSSYTYTRLGRLDDPAGVAAAVGRGSVDVIIEAVGANGEDPE